MNNTNSDNNQSATDSSAKTITEIKRLASMSAIEYDQQRRASAQALGIRVEVLDREVLNARSNLQPDSELRDPEPWGEPVSPAEILSEISTLISRFIVCEAETVLATTLWIAFTWFIDVVKVAPIAAITAPEKRCGKSQLLYLIGLLCKRPITASNITSAALFRCVEAWAPTLLVDEADSFMRENEELRGIINAGHTRGSAYVIRIVGEEMIPKQFSVWGAKAVAGIGSLPETVMDRSIILTLRRKLPNERVERLRHADAGQFEILKRKLSRFAADYRDQVAMSRPMLPDQLNDRAQDNWEPLLSIAETGGVEWLSKSVRAALKMNADEGGGLSASAELLSDIRDVFDAGKVERITPGDLVAALCKDDELAWLTYNRGRPMTVRQLNKKLREFGIEPSQSRLLDGRARSFSRSFFEEAWQRYLCSDTSEPDVSAGQTNQSDDLGVTQTGASRATVDLGVTAEQWNSQWKKESGTQSREKYDAARKNIVFDI